MYGGCGRLEEREVYDDGGLGGEICSLAPVRACDLDSCGQERGTLSFQPQAAGANQFVDPTRRGTSQ